MLTNCYSTKSSGNRVLFLNPSKRPVNTNELKPNNWFTSRNSNFDKTSRFTWKQSTLAVTRLQWMATILKRKIKWKVRHMRDSSFVQFTGPELLISLRSVSAFNHKYVEDRQIKFQTLEVKNRTSVCSPGGSLATQQLRSSLLASYCRH